MVRGGAKTAWRGCGGTRGASGKESVREVNRISGDDSTSAHSTLASNHEVPEASAPASIPAAPALPPLSALFAQDSGDELSLAVVKLAAVLPTTTITTLVVSGGR